jgi:hypothetical protein
MALPFGGVLQELRGQMQQQVLREQQMQQWKLQNEAMRRELNKLEASGPAAQSAEAELS